MEREELIKKSIEAAQTAEGHLAKAVGHINPHTGTHLGRAWADVSGAWSAIAILSDYPMLDRSEDEEPGELESLRERVSMLERAVSDAAGLLQEVTELDHLAWHRKAERWLFDFYPKALQVKDDERPHNGIVVDPNLTGNEMFIMPVPGQRDAEEAGVAYRNARGVEGASQAVRRSITRAIRTLEELQNQLT